MSKARLHSITVGYCERRRQTQTATASRHAVAAKLRGLEIDIYFLANLPEKKRTQWALTKDEMKNRRRLKPKLDMAIVQGFNSSKVQGPSRSHLGLREIEFVEWSPNGDLRHSKFVGLRDDKDARSVRREE